MEFTSYEMVSENTASLNTGSYLNQTEYSMFVNGFSSDLWYGFSASDVIEFSVWDSSNNFIGWNVLNQSKNYNEITLSYLNTLNFPVTYSYAELQTDFILYKNAGILVNPCEELSSSMGILDGSYFLTYNFTREMAGTPTNPLVIKDISPSSLEIKLTPLSSSNAIYDAFCQKLILFSDVIPLYLQGVKSCPYSQIYSEISPVYQSQINTIKSVFYLTTDGAMVSFLQNLYEDFVIYTTIPKMTSNGDVSVNDRLIRIQGIQTYFNNYLLSNSNTVGDFSDIDNQYNGFVSASIERKFYPIGQHPSQQYVEAKAFVYDFFTKFFYQPVSDLLRNTYHEKYFSFLKNGLNFGNNRLLPILTHGFIDERQNPDDPLTLLVKLESELPSDITIQTSCWVSNISLTPYVVSAILKNPNSEVVHVIGPPDFSIAIPNVSLTNANKSYTAMDLENDNETTRELTVSKKLAKLSVDYTDFTNFVVFSSAQLRLNIFKNKIINASSLSSSIQTIDDRNIAFIAASGSVYPYYEQEWGSIQGQINEIVNSFDGYESYLYRSGNYTYTNGTFISSSFIADMDFSASCYDKNNHDSLMNNCPEHILVDSNNDDYIIFLSMIGHFFDEIYIYIANLPSEKHVGHGSTEAFTRRIVDYMLETFGWKLDESLEQANLVNNFLTSDQINGLNSMSAEDRLKEVRNRILINLPIIYKTKGTETSVRAILACYGIPSSLLTIREYGGINYTENAAEYTTYERSYMYQWDTSSKYDYFQTSIPTNCNTFLLKFCVDDATTYPYAVDQNMLGLVSSSATRNSPSGSGQWAVGFTRVPGNNLGSIYFRIGYDNDPQLKITSSVFPLFDGNIYNIMVRRTLTPYGFDFDPLSSSLDAIPCIFDLYVQRNEFGNQILQLTSSIVSYDYSLNNYFSSGATNSNLMLGGWFADRNGQGFTGAMDKLQVWYDTLPDSNFEDYVNSINSYSFSGSRPSHQSLVARMHTDYPFDMRVAGQWRNANPFYATNSLIKQEAYLLPSVAANSDLILNFNAWSGSEELVYNTASCKYISQSIYPWQFKIIEYPSTWGISKYGPNKFHNEKIRYTTQTVATRFDDKERSTYIAGDIAPDSNQLGFFADPQDFHNKDIVRYFGNFDFMDSIGDPTNQFCDSYQSLNLFRKQYATSLNENSGSKTLFNELITLHKLYFNRSIFDAIKNVVPARSNVLLGVLIEPSILERPKYQSKPIYSESNTGSVFYYEVTASHYFRDPNTKLVRMSQSLLYGDFNFNTNSVSNFNTNSLPNNYTIGLDIAYVTLPNRIYPFNYLPNGTYIGDVQDPYQMGTFAGGIVGDPLQITPPIPILPLANFTSDITTGNYPLTVNFINTSTNSIGYLWDFGTGTQSIDINPTYVYENPGTYDVVLTAYRGEVSNVKINPSYVNVLSAPSVPCIGNIAAKNAGTTGGFPYSQIINIGSATGSVMLRFNAQNVPDKYILIYNGVQVINTGYRGASSYQGQLNSALFAKGLPSEPIKGVGAGTASFLKTSSVSSATLQVWSPIVGTGWNWTASCPGQTV
jgi:PKD repeat protein